MYSLEQIREDLRDIRYYYAHKDVFDKNEVSVGVNEKLRNTMRL